jgi:hypothetical protein
VTSRPVRYVTEQPDHSASLGDSVTASTRIRLSLHTAAELVRTCLDNGLVPSYWENHFTGLRTILTSGIPTARNRQGGHGAGTLMNNDPPAELVSYVLHMTASTILFLSEAEKKLP